MHARQMRITGLPAPLQIAADPIAQVAEVADRSPGWPCRRCLQDARIGEVMLLVSYDPWSIDSPFRQPGPVFVHERDCEPWSGEGLPEQLTCRLLSVRVIDHDGMQIAADVVPGTDLSTALDRALSNDDTAFVHVHNAGPGCFAVRVDRSVG
jgi:hypothetical protein